jgi:hypothetical protein
MKLFLINDPGKSKVGNQQFTVFVRCLEQQVLGLKKKDCSEMIPVSDTIIMSCNNSIAMTTVITVTL